MNITINKINQYTINFEIEDKNRPITVNYQTGEITSYTGRKVKNMPTLLKTADNKGVRLFILQLSTLMNIVKNLTAENLTIESPELCFNESQKYQKALKDYQAIETFLPQIERVIELVPENPKGYINFILENNLTIDTGSLYLFKLNKGLNNLPEMYRKYWFALTKYFIDKPIICNKLLNTTISEKLAICKIFKVSQSNLGLSIGSDFYELFAIILTNEINWLEIIDTNRTARQNIKLVSDYFEAQKDEIFNTAMDKTEKRIDKITTLETEHFIIIVPHTLKELQDEGKMQNNCVGYNYNTSIKKGENAIYFIRKKSSPDKSYITCRYNFKSKKTVEKKTINNTWTAPQEAKDLIKMVDEMLKD